MRSIRCIKGYTVVEVMIFLAVSTALFGSAMTLVGDAQDNAEFRYGIQDFASQIRDITNDVSTGFYEVPANTECRAAGASQRPSVSTGPAEIGESDECIFIGRLLHFAAADQGTDIADDNQTYTVYSVVGRRTRETGANKRDVINVVDARPVISNILRKDVIVPNGLRIESSEDIASGRVSGAVGFFTNFAQYAENNQSRQLESTARNVQLITMPGLPLNSGFAAVNTRLDTINEGDGDLGAVVCIEGFGYSVDLDLGRDASELTTDIEITRGECS